MGELPACEGGRTPTEAAAQRRAVCTGLGAPQGVVCGVGAGVGSGRRGGKRASAWRGPLGTLCLGQGPAALFRDPQIRPLSDLVSALGSTSKSVCKTDSTAGGGPRQPACPAGSPGSDVPLTDRSIVRRSSEVFLMEGEACGSVRGGRTEQVSRGLLFGLTCSLQGEGVRAGPQGWGAGRVKRRGFRAGQSWSTLCCRCLDFLGVPRLHPALGRPGVRWSWAEVSADVQRGAPASRPGRCQHVTAGGARGL